MAVVMCLLLQRWTHQRKVRHESDQQQTQPVRRARRCLSCHVSVGFWCHQNLDDLVYQSKLRARRQGKEIKTFEIAEEHRTRSSIHIGDSDEDVTDDSDDLQVLLAEDEGASGAPEQLSVDQLARDR